MARSRTFRKYRGWMAFAALVAVALAVFMLTRSPKSEAPATTYSTEKVSKGTLSATVSGTGNLELPDTEEAWPDSAGTVASVKVEKGDHVDKGDVLYTLDGDDAEAATQKALTSYQQAKTQVLQATAQVDKAEASLAALEARQDQPNSTVTSADIKSAKADIASAKSSLAAAKSSRSSAYSSYEDAVDAEGNLKVKSPISGIVWSVDIEKGDSVSTGSGSSSGSAASSSSSSGSSGSGSSSGSSSSSSSSGSGSSAPVVVVPNKPMIVTLAVNEVDLPSLKKGQRATVEFDALPDLSMTGKVTDIADEGTVSSGVVTFDVTVKLDVVNKQLKPGLSASSVIVTNVARDVLMVSNSAVKSDTNGNYVQVLKNGQPSQVSVETGVSSDTQTEIKSGVSEGDTIVTSTSSSSSSSSSGSGKSGGAPGMGMMFGGRRD